MTFEDWADRLELRASPYTRQSSDGGKSPWRCSGPCGQLMYGVYHYKGWNWPHATLTPAGSYISDDYPRVCEVCWHMYNVPQFTERTYWKNITSTEKKKFKQLKREGDFLA